MIIVIAGLYVVNTIVELVDMVGLVTLHPGSANAFSLLSSSVAIWMANVLTFSIAVLANRSGRCLTLGRASRR